MPRSNTIYTIGDYVVNHVTPPETVRGSNGILFDINYEVCNTKYNTIEGRFDNLPGAIRYAGVLDQAVSEAHSFFHSDTLGGECTH